VNQRLPFRPASPPAFDLAGPLPSGVTLLEASAGTGKTYTIAALATRYVAAGVPLDQLLVVTFTRMATGELRDRVRERLVTAAEGLGRGSGDELTEILAAAEPDEVERRAERLGRAVAEFDAATIDTTHGFCLQVLTGLGVMGDVDPADTSLVENVEDLIDEVVDDLYVRRFVASGDWRPLRRSEARRIAAQALSNPGARVLPELQPTSVRTAAALRRRLVGAVYEEMERRKRAAGILTYDDLLTRLRDTLAHATRGDAACARLRSRYSVVLVDEFQDTDPVQWEILRRAFAGGTLVLIGDPKQAIYAFRGADVFAYLDAAEQAAGEWTLGINWRSDQGLLDALDALFDGCQLGHRGIVHRTVEAAPANKLPRLVGATPCEPLRLRVLDRSTVENTRGGYATVGPARLAIANDVAGEVARLLASGAELLSRDEQGAETGRRALRAGDLAALVRTNLQARMVREALSAAGVPAVLGGGGSVFSTGTAEEWLRLLEALERPTARDRAAAAALTSIVGWNAAQVAGADDDAWEDFHWQLHRWAGLLQRRGVAALLEAVTAARQIPSRVLTGRGGERYLTDLRHVGQLLHGAQVTDGLGPTALVGWLRRRIDDADRDADDADRTLRLESDSEAVQVLTVHRSKGLEFPIVFCPYFWDSFSSDTVLPVFHDPEQDFVRTIDVSGEGPDFDAHKLLHRDEERGEDLRLLYVGLTRARHQAVVWWAGGAYAGNSPLGRLLFAPHPGGLVPPEGRRTPADSEALATLAALADRAGGTISVERMPLERWSPKATASGAQEAPAPVLAAGVFDRDLDRSWRRSSFSSITADSHVPVVGSEQEEAVLTDEPPQAADEEATAGELLLGAMPGGLHVGTLIHKVFEITDFAAQDIRAEVYASLSAELGRSPIDLGDRDRVVQGLVAAIEAPLGPLAGEMRLRDIGRADRVDEMTFEFPLAGAEHPTGHVSPADIARLLREHGADDDLGGYAARLADPTLAVDLRGYLTGSLDLVMRLPGPRFVVADYKTNKLGTTSSQYRQEALEEEMLRSHYPLQAILYTVALHRYLRWRMPGYDCGRHLGGVLYLFLRGMSGGAGIWSWHPPASLVEALSNLFDRGAG
jgi:exodeoxyribonuclease V beta subunit